jgi:hypothetical protein
MAATPGERMNKATGANRGDQRRGRAPSRADHGAGAEMIGEGRAAKESTIVDLMAVQTCAALRKFDARSEAASSKIRLLGRAIAACWRFRGERHIVHAARVGYRLPNSLDAFFVY